LKGGAFVVGEGCGASALFPEHQWLSASERSVGGSAEVGAGCALSGTAQRPLSTQTRRPYTVRPWSCC